MIKWKECKEKGEKIGRARRNKRKQFMDQKWNRNYGKRKREKERENGK